MKNSLLVNSLLKYGWIMSINIDPYLLRDIMNSQISYVSWVKFLVNFATSPTNEWWLNFINILLKIFNIFKNYIFFKSLNLSLFSSFEKKLRNKRNVWIPTFKANMIREIVGASLSSSSLVVCLTSIFHPLFDSWASFSSMTTIFGFWIHTLVGMFLVIWVDGNNITIVTMKYWA